MYDKHEAVLRCINVLGNRDYKRFFSMNLVKVGIVRTYLDSYTRIFKQSFEN